MIDPYDLTNPANQILLLWNARECFICGQTGNCKHKEPEIALAQLEGARFRQEQHELELIRLASLRKPPARTAPAVTFGKQNRFGGKP